MLNMMIRILYSLAVCIFNIVFITSCTPKKVHPSENIISINIALDSVQKITASKRIIAKFMRSPNLMVKAEGPENMVNALVSKYDQGNLFLEVSHGDDYFEYTDSSQIVSVIICAPCVKEFNALAGGIIELDTITTPDTLVLTAIGSSSITGSFIKAGFLDITAIDNSSIHFQECIATKLSVRAVMDSKVEIPGTYLDINTSAWSSELNIKKK